MAFVHKFLGQSLTIGRYSGFPTARTILLEAGSGFSVLNYFIENDYPLDEPVVVLFKDGNDQNIFGLGIQHTDNDGWRCFVKWADNNIGLIPDSDTIPTSGPWNDWNMLGAWDNTYTGYDPDNITFEDHAHNSFAFYTQETALYPYYDAGAGVTFTADQCRDNSPVNLILCEVLRNYDGTAIVNFTGQTPIDVTFDGDYTNWIDSNNVYQPSYTIGSWGRSPDNIYNPLSIEGAWEADHFDEDTAGPGGNYPTGYGYTGDNFGFSDPIKLSAINTGFITLFSPTSGQLINLADYLWSSNFVDTLKKLYRDPFESIISFGILPCNLYSIRENTASAVVIGNVSTGIDMYKLSNQYYTKSFGYMEVPENWGSCDDYEPYTTAQVYLPFIGFVPVKANEIMDSRVFIKYMIDCLSGDCIAQIKIVKNRGNTHEVLVTEHRGNCLINVPVTGANFTNFFTNFISNPISVATGALSSGAGAGAAVGGVVGQLMGASDCEQQRSGNYGGNSAAFTQRHPAIILSRPKQQYPQDYNKYIGYPSYITYTLGNADGRGNPLKGFTQVADIIDNEISGATDKEREEIERMLKEGVIL